MLTWRVFAEPVTIIEEDKVNFIAIRESFPHKIFKVTNSPKFYQTTILHYTVVVWPRETRK